MHISWSSWKKITSPTKEKKMRWGICYKSIIRVKMIRKGWQGNYEINAEKTIYPINQINGCTWYKMSCRHLTRVDNWKVSFYKAFGRKWGSWPFIRYWHIWKKKSKRKERHISSTCDNFPSKSPWYQHFSWTWLKASFPECQGEPYYKCRKRSRNRSEKKNKKVNITWRQLRV